jgi:hypothetical protein
MKWPLWSSGSSSWSWFDSRHCQIFWEVVGLERGPLSLVSTIEDLLERKSSNSGLENRDNCRGNLRANHATSLYPQKLALSSPTNGGRSVGIVLSRTKAKKLFLLLLLLVWHGVIYTVVVFVWIVILHNYLYYVVILGSGSINIFVFSICCTALSLRSESSFS